VTEGNRFPVYFMLLFLAIAAVPTAGFSAERGLPEDVQACLAAMASGAYPSSSKTERAWMPILTQINTRPRFINH